MRLWGLCSGRRGARPGIFWGRRSRASRRRPTAQYRVNYRPSDTDPWQLYAQSRDPARANTIAAGGPPEGYQAEVVDDATPVPQFYPDAADTSASNYYPTSNWAADYNQYVGAGRELRLWLVRRLEPLVPASRLSQLTRRTPAATGTTAGGAGAAGRGAGDRGTAGATAGTTAIATGTPTTPTAARTPPTTSGTPPPPTTATPRTG